MKLHRKIFWTMAVTVVGISAVFIALTHYVTQRAVGVGIHAARAEDTASLAARLSDYYANHNRSWEGVSRLNLLASIERERPSVLVLDEGRRTVLHQGDSPPKLISRLGVREDIAFRGESVGHLYYYDPEVAYFNKIMIGIPISVLFVLIGGGLLLILITLVVAYRLSRWLASPLRALLPPIERLGRGELGVQAPVDANDEYGQIAAAFNRMSAKLGEAEKLRRNLSADIAHELRTPLTIIGGKLDDLQQRGRPVPPETLLPLQDELLRLNRLVEDLRTLSLAEAGQLRLNRQEADMADLARRIVQAFEPLAEEKEISIRLEVATDRTILFADPGRMKQVLVNLLANAIRYTPSRGTIEIRLENEADRRLAITVEDSGSGIAPEHLPHLFDRFYRTDEARDRDGGGTGLGLAIAKQFVLSHDGTIEAESRMNRGTRFVVRLPYLTGT